MTNVAFLVDGSFLPINNGTSYSILTLMEALSGVDGLNPSLVISWRGWDNPALYYNKFFKTIFIPIDYFYENNGIFEYSISTLNIDFVHIYNSEEVINLAEKFHRSGTKIIYEAVNIDHVLNRRLGLSDEVIRSSKDLQIEAMTAADYIMCRSDVDRSHIIDMGIKQNRVSVYRGAINADAIPFKERNKCGKKIVFMGHMYYPPNENALEYIAHTILPSLKAMDGEYTITIIGSIPDGVVKKYSDTDIVFKGNVRDIGKELLEYDIAIAPLFEGSGTRLKLLDYMASGLPTITTTLGVEGLYESIADNLVIEDDLSNYARTINNLSRDTVLYNRLSVAGRNYVQDYYSWINNIGPFLDIYKK